MTSKQHNNIKIVKLEEKHFADVSHIFNEGFGSKTLCFCISGRHTVKEFTKLHDSSPRKRDIAFVAIEEDTQEILGYIQLSKPGVPAFYGMHTCKDNEVYIDQIGVAARARGQRIGTKLLEYSEEYVRNEIQGIEIMTLEVLKGNPAIGLYERFGYEIKPVGSFSSCCTALFVLLILGRPYGLCHPKCGSHWMIKKL